MCGIFGGAWRRDAPGIPDHQLRSAASALHHRGPDDEGITTCTTVAGTTVALGHTRLSILDLSSAGHQPMADAGGRYTVAFNGEIYNFVELRSELSALGHTFHTTTDTEVLVAAWAEWGVASLERLTGMFSFVVLDHHEQTLWCVRDAFGIKPFFYTWADGRFIYASELPSLLRLAGRRPRVDIETAYRYLVHGEYDAGKRTFLQDVNHLQPGHFLRIDLSALGAEQQQRRWWHPPVGREQDISFGDAVDMVRESFLASVRLHLRSDVPVGAALSGGIDSSAVVCAIRYLEPDLPIDTFTYRAEDPRIAEGHWADIVNAHVGARPHAVQVGSGDLGNHDLDDLIRIQGEPFGSTSIYAQHRVFRAAREAGVVVTLDGQGADELLAGYDGYPGRRMLSLWETAGAREAHRFARAWGARMDVASRRPWLQMTKAALPGPAFRAGMRLTAGNPVPPWLNRDLLGDAGVQTRHSRPVRAANAQGRRVIEQMSEELQHNGLPALLRHADRNSMAVSVESRVPFLTVGLAEQLLTLPEEYLISPEGETKRVFRAAMRGIVPDQILNRQDKIGFEAPDRNWVLSDAVGTRERLRAAASIDLFDAPALLRAFDDVVAGKEPYSRQVWRWLNFVTWWEQIDAVIA